MFENLSFKALESSLQALQLKRDVTINNLANIETCGYKAQRVSFRRVMEEAKDKQASGKRESYSFQATISTSTDTQVRADGNNVDFDRENTELMNVYFQTLAIYQKINGQINDTRYVMKQAFK